MKQKTVEFIFEMTFLKVYWTSPPKGHGCIDFKAMVVERADVWYMDDGELTYAMCEDDAPLSEPQVRIQLLKLTTFSRKNFLNFLKLCFFSACNTLLCL